MTRTVTAFYQTRAEAEQVSASLKAANLGANVEIIDQASADAHPTHHTFVDWLGNFFGGHDDKHAYGEGVRRGHFLLTAKVDELNETRAAEILDSAAPVDLGTAQQSWRDEGWTAPSESAAPGAAVTTVTPVKLIGVRIRSYSFDG